MPRGQYAVRVFGEHNDIASTSTSRRSERYVSQVASAEGEFEGLVIVGKSHSIANSDQKKK